MPRDAVSRTANVERTGRHKWVNRCPVEPSCNSYTLEFLQQSCVQSLREEAPLGIMGPELWEPLEAIEHYGNMVSGGLRGVLYWGPITMRGEIFLESR